MSRIIRPVENMVLYKSFNTPWESVLRIRIQDLEPFCFWLLDLGSKKGFFRILDLKSWILNPSF
jgi:hypothetical protein